MDSTVITALIAFGGVLLSILGSTVGTYFINKKLNKENNEVQKGIANQNIAANIIAKSRIEWIQEVRKATSKLISAYSELAKIDPNDSNEYFNKIVDFQEKNEILILFFGNDSAGVDEFKNLENLIYFDVQTSKFIVEEEIKRKLFEKGNNKNKNDIIVFYLKTLKKYFDYFNNTYSEKIKYKSEWKKAELMYLDRMMSPESYEETIYTLQTIDEYGNEGMVATPVSHRKLDENEYDYYATKLNFFNIPKNLVNNMAFLSDIMRLYLKIEWNESKMN